MKHILIWGTGVRGKNTFDFFQDKKEFQVVAFGDNDPEKQGKEFCGKQIIGSSELRELSDLDYVIIASQFSEAIYEQLIAIVQVPVYENLHKMALVDIAGWCNARCKWCVTGRKNRRIGHLEQHNMSFELFKKLYYHLTDITILAPWNELLLYNWGEPFLNPDCIKIMEFLSEEGQAYCVSTNASVVALATNKDTYQHCRTFTFSMPGFSQSSYDQIHGFSFEKIRENIKKFAENLNQCGFKGEMVLSYHVYQFNQGEVEKARAFADSLGIRFAPIYASFADSELTIQYLTDTMSYDVLKDAGKHLLLHYVDGLLENRPKDFPCPLENMVSINTDGNLELCCCNYGADGDEWGKVLEIKDYMQWKNLRREMLTCQTCRTCRDVGLNYWIVNAPEYIG